MEKYKFILKITVSFAAVIFVFLFGEIFIKNAYDDLYVIEPGYKNLAQVRMTANGKIGSGVLYDVSADRILILTSKHLLNESWQPSVEFGDGYIKEGKVNYYFPDMDAAIAEVQRDDGMSGLLYAPKIAGAADYDMMEIGEEVFYADGMKDDEISLMTGKLADKNVDIGLEQQVGLFEGKVKAGMSGEGLFDEEGRLIGIIVAADDNFGAFIPAYILSAEAEEYYENCN